MPTRTTSAATPAIGATAPGGERRSSWHVLTEPAFLAYFGGSLASNLGTWLQNTAQMLLAYQLTHSALAVGMVTSAQFSGFLLLGPYAGSIADRFGARRALVAAQLISASIAAGMAYLTLTGQLSEKWLVAGSMAIGFAFTIALPLQTTMIPELLTGASTSDRDAKAAMAMNSVSYNAGRTLAPVLAVLILTTVGAVWAFTLNALSFVVFAATIRAIYPASASSRATTRSERNALRIVFRQPRILLLLAMVASVTLADDPVLVLGPALARQVLHVPSAWSAYFLSALGLGTIVGAALPTKTPTSYRAAMPLLLLSVSVVVFTSGQAVWLSWVAALVAGVAALLTGSSTQALLFKSARPGQAAQVMALWAVAWAGTKPFASLADGWLATHLGVFHAGLVLAAPALILAAIELSLPPPAKEWAKRLARPSRGRHRLVAR